MMFSSFVSFMYCVLREVLTYLLVAQSLIPSSAISTGCRRVRSETL